VAREVPGSLFVASDGRGALLSQKVVGAGFDAVETGAETFMNQFVSVYIPIIDVVRGGDGVSARLWSTTRLSTCNKATNLTPFVGELTSCSTQP
jgi:hypothetical protein